jgi:hypothetical protein
MESRTKQQILIMPLVAHSMWFATTRSGMELVTSYFAGKYDQEIAIKTDRIILN